ncbi:MAG: GNAT family N-acetyltransferase [Candidatus Taylorbacteria bacterium]|nr:GNAT family N-acetyltransferase [Candidatus Taylorbacteria bacterium]
MRRDLWYPTLFGGDRITCCDEAVIAELEEKIIAIASIAPQGEMTSGQPTIVGLYTVRSFRRQGYGKTVMEAAVRRCLERGFTKIRVDAISKSAMKTVQSLPDELRVYLEVNDQSGLYSFLE